VGEELLDLMERVRRGEVTAEAAANALSRETDLGFAVVDDHRATRTGLPEVVFGQGKTPEQVAHILLHLCGQGLPALATRVEPHQAEAVLRQVPDAVYEAVPRLLWLAGEHPAFQVRVEGVVAVVSAGTSDLPVAEEAARCAEWFGLEVARAWDVGVAGLHRLLSRLDVLREARAIIAVAGMEGALPSVIAGLVPAPVIAVPTSTGYGTHLGGLTPLFAMLNSCASGVVVVNVDNGFGAAQAAWRILGTEA